MIENSKQEFLEAGRELDALVAEKVMGCRPQRLNPSRADWACTCKSGNHANDVQVGPQTWLKLGKPYSTDIAAAMEITRKCGNTWAMFWHDAYAQWQVKCDPKRDTFEGCRFEAWAFELPTAICAAALRMVGVTVDLEDES